LQGLKNIYRFISELKLARNGAIWGERQKTTYVLKLQICVKQEQAKNFPQYFIDDTKLQSPPKNDTFTSY